MSPVDRRRFLRGAAGLLAGLCLGAAARAGELREATLAKVGDRLICLSDLHDEWRLNRLLEKQGAKAVGPLPGRTELEPVRQQKIDQLVTLNYLDKLGLWPEMRKEDREELERRLLRAAGDRERLNDWIQKSGLSLDRWLQLLWARRRVERLADEKFRNASPAAAEAALREWQAKEREKAQVEQLPWNRPETPKG